MRPAENANGSSNEYNLLSTDDALVARERGEHILRNELGRYFKLKEASIGPPNCYLGGRLRKS